MLTTESKARAGWCPMVRAARIETPEAATREIVVAGCNTDALGRNRVPASCRCIASACMMWRWDTDGINSLQRKRLEVHGGAELVDEPPRPEAMPASWEWCPHDPMEGNAACWVEPQADMPARRVGYCGMAGMPLELAKIVAEAGR